MVVQQVKINKSLISEEDEPNASTQLRKDSSMQPFGAGVRIALNENFILAVDYGFAMKKEDGLKGLYIKYGNLF